MREPGDARSPRRAGLRRRPGNAPRGPVTYPISAHLPEGTETTSPCWECCMIALLEPTGVASLRRSRSGHLISIYTDRAPAFYDITDEVMEAVRRSHVEDGIALVYSRHTTAAIKINEHEPLLIED